MKVSSIDEPLNPGMQRGDKLPPPTNSVILPASIQLTAIETVMLRAAGIRPYGLACTIQLTLSKNPPAVGPLQSALRAAS